MGRKIGWDRTDIKGGGRSGPDKDRQFKGIKGTTFIIRVMTDCEERRTHFVDDVLPPKPDGEAAGFSLNCSKEWDDSEEAYVGACYGCDEKEYDLAVGYVAGVLVLGSYKGRSTRVQAQDAGNAVHWWAFGADKYRQLSDIMLDAQRAGKKIKSLKQLELVVKVDDSDKAEQFQKLRITMSQSKPLLTKANAAEYKEAWAEEGPPLLEACLEITDEQEWKRSTKKKKGKRSREEELDLDEETEEEEEEETKKPRRGSKKKTKKKRGKKKAPEPEEEEEEGEEEEEDEYATGEEDLDDILDDI